MKIYQMVQKAMKLVSFWKFSKLDRDGQGCWKNTFILSLSVTLSLTENKMFWRRYAEYTKFVVMSFVSILSDTYNNFDMWQPSFLMTSFLQKDYFGHGLGWTGNFAEFKYMLRMCEKICIIRVV